MIYVTVYAFAFNYLIIVLLDVYFRFFYNY